MGPLNVKLPTTLYFQLKELLMSRITMKEWNPGDKIPNELSLCHEYGVSRITVRQALTELEREGYIIRKQGKGTFVSFPRIEQNLTSFYSFSDEFKKRGFKPSNKILEFHLVIPVSEIAARLGIENTGKQVYYIKRLRYADETLVAIESTYLPADLFNDLNLEELESKSLYEIMRQKYDVNPNSAEESIGATSIGDREAIFFGAKKGTAALDIERFAFSGSRCVEYTSGIVRGDVFRFHVKLT